MWEPRPLATLGASTACNSDIFTFLIYSNSRNEQEHNRHNRNKDPFNAENEIIAFSFKVFECKELAMW
jgi:hypothetical protein